MLKIIFNISSILLFILGISGVFRTRLPKKEEPVNRGISVISLLLAYGFCLWAEAYCGAFAVWTVWQYTFLAYVFICLIFSLSTIDTKVTTPTPIFRMIGATINIVLLFGCGYFYPLLHWVGIQ